MTLTWLSCPKWSTHLNLPFTCVKRLFYLSFKLRFFVHQVKNKPKKIINSFESMLFMYCKTVLRSSNLPRPGRMGSCSLRSLGWKTCKYKRQLLLNDSWILARNRPERSARRRILPPLWLQYTQRHLSQVCKRRLQFSHAFLLCASNWLACDGQNDVFMRATQAEM